MNTHAVIPALCLAAACLTAAAPPPQIVPVGDGSPPSISNATSTASAHGREQGAGPKVGRKIRHGHRGAQSAAGIRDVAIATRAATLEPTASGFVNAVQVYPFSEGAVFHVLTAPGQVTDITLQAGEALVSVASGDTVRWVIGDTTSGNGDGKQTHVLVKPYSAGLSTNLVITTDRRSYHLVLSSTTRIAMAALSWIYPQDQLLAVKRNADAAQAAAPVANGVAFDQLHFNYTVTGDTPPWRPLRAFDDGRQTFIEFPADIGVGEAPPLFVVGAKGESELVNYRMRGHFYVVDRLFATAELRLGLKRQDVVRITRVTEAAQGRRRS